MGHNIVDVRHCPGQLNQAADRISRQFTEVVIQKGDGHEWTINPGWTVNAGLVHNIWSAEINDATAALQERFMDEPVFAEVIDAMWNLDHGRSTPDKRWARHRILGYQIDSNKLWRIGDGKSTRACTRLECITQNEAKEMARLEHQKNSHFG